MLEETYTDQEFCKSFHVDRATSLRWRDLGIVGYVKLPNGAIRYRQKHIDALWANFEKMEKLGVTLKDLYRSLKGGVVNVSVPEGSTDVRMPQDPTHFSQGEPALDKTSGACMAEIMEPEVSDPSNSLSGSPRALYRIRNAEDPCTWVAPGQCKEFHKKARGHKNGS